MIQSLGFRGLGFRESRELPLKGKNCRVPVKQAKKGPFRDQQCRGWNRFLAKCSGTRRDNVMRVSCTDQNQFVSGRVSFVKAVKVS